MQSKVNSLLKNLVFWNGRISSIEEGIRKLKGKEKYLEAIHVYLESIRLDDYKKKEYFNISKVEKLSKLDEWIYDKLVNEEEYRGYLDKYLKLKNKLKFDDIDKYILKKHYYPKAIDMLSKRLINFNLDAWQKKRFSYKYERKTELFLKDGSNLRFDFRNTLESIFILKANGDKCILAIGGSGGSYQRERYTLFTAIFYLLSRSRTIKHHLLKYNHFNKFEYIRTFHKPIITIDFGSNYPLDEKLQKKISNYGIQFKLTYLCS
jgi:hypothetical protein